MRFLAILPLICAIGAFVLSMLCLFAGSNPNFLTNADLLTLNTSMLGENIASKTAATATSALPSNVPSALASSVAAQASATASNIATSLNIHDFYSAHLLDYCEGYYAPSPRPAGGVQPSKNVVNCSSHSPLSTFDPTAVINAELRPGVSLADLKWPNEVQTAVTALQVASKAMFILYCLGVGFAGLAVVGALFGFFGEGLLGPSLNLVFDFLAFLALGIASAIATVLIVKVVDAVNQYGNQIGVEAYKGTTFLIMTWIATAAMLLASLSWIFVCCTGRRKKAAYAKEG